MKLYYVVLFILLVFRSLSLAGEARSLQRGDLIAICGDSITGQRGYSAYLATYLLACQPEPDLRSTLFGWGGESASGFKNRIVSDILPIHPTVATLSYGMNDGNYLPKDPAILKSFRENLQSSVRILKEGGLRFILVGSPTAVDSDRFNRYKRGKPNRPTTAAEYNETLAAISAVGREVAAEEGVAFVDVHTVMMGAMAQAKAKYGREYIVGGGDGIHPSANGSFIATYAFLKGLGCSGDIAQIALDMQTGESTASSGQRILTSAKNRIELESTRYPFCFEAKGTLLLEALEFIPFNQELNRYLFTIKNATAPSYKVTWGEMSKTYTAKELEAGVNLAADFRNNPFSKPFRTVYQRVMDQQLFEMAAYKGLISRAQKLKTEDPSQAALVDEVEQAVHLFDDVMRAASKKAVAPVLHSLIIEPVE